MEQNFVDRNLKCSLDCDPENALVYTGHTLIDMRKSIMIEFIFQSLFDGQKSQSAQYLNKKLSRSR